MPESSASAPCCHHLGRAIGTCSVFGHFRPAYVGVETCKLDTTVVETGDEGIPYLAFGPDGQLVGAGRCTQDRLLRSCTPAWAGDRSADPAGREAKRRARREVMDAALKARGDAERARLRARAAVIAASAAVSRSQALYVARYGTTYPLAA